MNFFVSFLVTFWALQNSLLALSVDKINKDNLIPFCDFGLPKWLICEGNQAKGSPKTAFIEVIEFLDHFLADFPCKSAIWEVRNRKKGPNYLCFFCQLIKQVNYFEVPEKWPIETQKNPFNFG